MKNQLVRALFDLTMDINEKGSDAFFTYYPHTSNVTISLYYHGWEEDKDPDYMASVYVSGELYKSEKYNQVIKILNDVTEGILYYL